jgi:hypothetical protein
MRIDMGIQSSRLLVATVLAAGLAAAASAGPVRTIASGACSAPCFDQTILPRNDDGSSVAAEPIGFPVNFFGQTYTGAFVNNNGNITFDGPLGVFTPFPINSASEKIIAPFFADVDTRNAASGLTRYGPGTVGGLPAWGVTWIDVGYYSSAADKKNSFQLVIINMSSVTGIAGDFDIEFNYDKIQWETGSASGGVNGLGGSSARAGFSNGSLQTGTFLELAGSAINGAFLDANLATGLIRRSLPPGSVPLGRYTFRVRDGRPELADLRVTGTDAPDPWSSGPLTYNFTVAHLGDGDPTTPVDPAATGTRLVNVLPAAVGAFVSVSPAGTCTYVSATRTVTCNVGTLSPGGSFTATVVTQPSAAPGTFLVNTAVVSSNLADPDTSNNSFIARTNANDPDASITPCNPAANPPGVTEGANCTFTVTLSNSSPLPITVSYAPVSGGTAVAGTDYTAASGTVTFPAATVQLTRTFNVATTNDTLDEDAETFSIALTAATNANLSTTQPTTASAQINDNDNAPSVKVSDCVVLEGDAGSRICEFTVGLFNAAVATQSGRTISVDYLLTDGTATIADLDYAPESVSGTLAFTPGKQSLPIRALVTGDVNVEAHETFNVALSNLSNLCTVSCAHDLNAVATIRNDDGPALTVQDVVVTEPPNTGGTVNATFTLSLTPASPNVVTTTVFTTPQTATANVDYTTLTSSLVSFPAGQTTRTVSVVVRHDLVDEPTETFLLSVNPAPFASVPDPVAVGSIVDNDGAVTGGPLELVHGSNLVLDLASPVAGSPDVDWFALAQAPYSSYEAVVDGVSGDLVSDPNPLRVRRLAADQISVLPPDATAVGLGRARSLRWQSGAAGALDQWLRVESGASGTTCDVDCGPEDTYRIRFYDTTLTVPRFNNASGQATVLVLQNITSFPASATVYLWGLEGNALGNHVLSIPARGVAALNTSTVTGAAGQSGSITIAHDAGYSGLVGKAVALEPASGFSFDSPMTLRAR